MRYTCGCCSPARSYSRSDKLALHRKKYDPTYVNHFDELKSVKEAYFASPKLCEAEGCGQPVPFAQRKKQKFCSHSCSAIVTNGTRVVTRASRQTKTCPVCEMEFKNKGAIHCSADCHYENLKTDRQERIRKWLTGELSAAQANGELCGWARDYLIEHVGHKCSECSWSRIHPQTNKVPLQVDHIDGDYTNNVPTNLRVLCPNCHSMTLTYGNLNRGKGRGYRLKK